MHEIIDFYWRQERWFLVFVLTLSQIGLTLTLIKL